MPATPAGLTAALMPSLLSVGMLGSDTPKIATGIGIGASNWLAQIKVVTVDSGTAGVGSGGPMPLIVSPVLIPNMLAAFIASGMIGINAPLLATGISNGLILGMPQGLVKTVHVGVGSGVGTAKFLAPPATPFMMAGLAAATIIGPMQVQLANGVGTALDVTFAILVMTVPIVGPPSPSGGSGAGFGSII